MVVYCTAVSSIVIFVSTGLLIYWVTRTLLLLNAPEDQIAEVLDGDLWWGRRLLMALRALFFFPNQFAG